MVVGEHCPPADSQPATSGCHDRASAELARHNCLAADVFAERNGLSVRSLKWWRWKITTDDDKAAKAARARTPTAFVEVVQAAPASRPHEPLEVLTPTGFLVRVPVGFDCETLRRVVEVLR